MTRDEYLNACRNNKINPLAKAITELSNEVYCDYHILGYRLVEANTPDSSLFLALSGEKGSGKRKVGKMAADYLMNKDGKITEVKDITMINLVWELYENTDHGPAYHPLRKNVLYILHDIKEFLHELDKEDPDGGGACVHTMKQLTRFANDVFIIITGEPEEIQRFKAYSDRANALYSKGTINVENYTPDMLFDKYVNLLTPEKKKLINDTSRSWFKKVVSLYDSKTIPFKNQELAEYLANYTNCSTNNKNLVIPKGYMESESKLSLDNIVGMSEVKKTLKEFENLMIFRKRAATEGLNLPSTNLHMLFTGNPGTGKTTIARIIANMLYDLGLVEHNDVREVAAQDLIAGYVGQTAIKTDDVIRSAMGGVLFIDEAYSIATKGGSEGYGKEAIAALVKAMEDHKDKLVVIYAGYHDEMMEFVDVNPGLASRIGFKFHFEDYTPNELAQMFEKKMKNAGFEVSQGAVDKVRELCKIKVNEPNFGNGRLIDRIIDRTLIIHASADVPDDKFAYISKTDIPSLKDIR